MNNLDKAIFSSQTSQFNEESNVSPLEPFPHLSTSTLCLILAYIAKSNKSIPVLKIFNAYKCAKEEYFQAYQDCCCKDFNEPLRNDTCFNEDQLRNYHKVKRKKESKLRLSKRRKLTETKHDSSPEKSNAELPIWHQKVPYDWTQVYSPRSTEFLIGNSGESD